MLPACGFYFSSSDSHLLSWLKILRKKIKNLIYQFKTVGDISYGEKIAGGKKCVHPTFSHEA